MICCYMNNKEIFLLKLRKLRPLSDQGLIKHQLALIELRMWLSGAFLCPTVLFFLTIFFNQLLASGCRANITPISKPNRDSNVITNWRPISQINCVSKMYEKILQKRINDNFSRIPDIFSCQFCFRERLSTYHHLAMLQSNINDGLNVGRGTTLIRRRILVI